MTLRTKQLGVRCFLEGIEIPLSGVAINAGLMQPATANITVIATDAIHDLKPRTLVHIFYYLFYFHK